jgi:hypothetical protein
MFNKISKLLPVVNFIITSTAFAFQTKVLYPYHNNLDKKFDTLEKKLDSLTLTNKSK